MVFVKISYEIPTLQYLETIIKYIRGGREIAVETYDQVLKEQVHMVSAAKGRQSLEDISEIMFTLCFIAMG